ncbi:Tyrosine-protein kinase [Parasponia andersonii]|uniref:Tyrosine-protein kinase n=1 Tax=Parasponia andersonii TaxID=3476 RepID=A0A2P5BCV9_PARAD|nr:Tyrosine-protein kinase [Parasponia andersonii]
MTGQLPLSLANLSQLVKLSLHGNQLSGFIPQELGSNWKSLVFSYMSSNHLQGPIPLSFLNLTNLRMLDRSFNYIKGSIPVGIGKLKNLKSLDLSLNNLTGPLLSTLFQLNKLNLLSLGYNKITGALPKTLGRLTNLTTLDLSSNQFACPIPPEIGNLTILYRSSLERNKLTGSIPSEFRNLKELMRLSPGFNKLSGPIFPSLSGLARIEYLDLSSNRLNCSIDSDIRSIKNLETLDISNNNLSGIIPSQLVNLKRTGGYGSVYRPQLPNGKIVSVKKLHGYEAEELTFLKSFTNEVNTLSEIRHRNIVRLYGFCMHKRCMLLIYEYMERGSLFCVLCNDVEAVELDWSKWVNVIKGTAHALSYMHHDCTPSIVHRDVTTSNILLNSELEAFVSDFDRHS